MNIRFPEEAENPITDSETGLTEYFVPAGSLGFSVVLFVSCAILCVITLLLRRCFVGGELGGSTTGRFMSCAFLCSLWMVYLTFSILQTKKIAF